MSKIYLKAGGCGHTTAFPGPLFLFQGNRDREYLATSLAVICPRGLKGQYTTPLKNTINRSPQEP